MPPNPHFCTYDATHESTERLSARVHGKAVPLRERKRYGSPTEEETRQRSGGGAVSRFDWGGHPPADRPAGAYEAARRILRPLHGLGASGNLRKIRGIED